MSLIYLFIYLFVYFFIYLKLIIVIFALGSTPVSEKFDVWNEIAPSTVEIPM